MSFYESHSVEHKVSQNSCSHESSLLRFEIHVEFSVIQFGNPNLCLTGKFEIDEERKDCTTHMTQL